MRGPRITALSDEIVAPGSPSARLIVPRVGSQELQLSPLLDRVNFHECASEKHGPFNQVGRCWRCAPYQLT